MGNCISTQQHLVREVARPLAADKGVDCEPQARLKEFNVLLLGPQRSGKTTIVRRLEMMYHNGTSTERNVAYRAIVRCNLLESAQSVVASMRRLGLDCVAPENRPRARRIYVCSCQERAEEVNRHVAREIHKLWQDPIISTVIDRSSGRCCIPDNATYFLANALRIGAPEYVPTKADVLHSWKSGTGITEMRFALDHTLTIRLVELGEPDLEHVGRNQWLQYFGDVASVIYCTSLSDYDQVLTDHPRETRLAESLMLFESVINSRWFRRSTIVLLLNKVDVFKSRLAKTPLEAFFPEYTGGSDVDKAVAFVSNRFLQANHSDLSVYLHVTQATALSEECSFRQILVTMKKTVLENASRDAYIL